MNPSDALVNQLTGKRAQEFADAPLRLASGIVVSAGSNWVSVNIAGNPYTIMNACIVGSIPKLGSTVPLLIQGSNAVALSGPTMGVGSNILGGGEPDSDSAGNVFEGPGALSSITLSGTGNVAVGYHAMKASTTAISNVAIGYEAMTADLTSHENVAIGWQAMATATNSQGNVAIGYQALSSAIFDYENTAVGWHSLQLCSSGGDNAALGYGTLSNLTTGTQNTGLGAAALGNTATGINNATAVGYNAAHSTTASNITAIGAGTNAGFTGSVAIGCDSAGTGSATTLADQIKFGTALSLTCLGTSAPALSATTGLPYMPATSGTPTGVPTAITGYVAFRYDTSGHLLWIYDGSWMSVSGGGASFATPAIVLGTAAAAGAASTVIRSDSTIVAFDATAPVTQAFGDSAATGSVALAARRDHKHGMPANPTPAFATPSLTLGTANSAGAAGTVIRSDATILAFDATVPVTQAFSDVAATGAATVAARRDHVHGMPASSSSFAAPSFTFTTSNAAGVASTAVRSDASLAIFDATVPTTTATGDAAAAGSAAFAARRDHVHGREAQVSGSTDVLAGLVTQGFRAASSNPPLNLGTGAVTAGELTVSDIAEFQIAAQDRTCSAALHILPTNTSMIVVGDYEIPAGNVLELASDSVLYIE